MARLFCVSSRKSPTTPFRMDRAVFAAAMTVNVVLLSCDNATVFACTAVVLLLLPLVGLVNRSARPKSDDLVWGSELDHHRQNPQDSPGKVPEKPVETTRLDDGRKYKRIIQTAVHFFSTSSTGIFSNIAHGAHPMIKYFVLVSVGSS